jgi:hypothetical protein
MDTSSQALTLFACHNMRDVLMMIAGACCVVAQTQGSYTITSPTMLGPSPLC